MQLSFHHNSGLTKFILIGEFLLVSYLLYALTVNVYQSYKIDLYIKKFEEENKQLEVENKRKSEEYLYYTSDAYIEKIAKQNLGLVNKGEDVIVLAEDGSKTSEFEGVYDGESLKRHYYLSNPQKWWRLFFESKV